MFVTVLHHINDSEGFEAAEQKALEAGLPPKVALPIHAATGDHRFGVCIWEGESVEAVRELVEDSYDLVVAGLPRAERLRLDRP